METGEGKPPSTVTITPLSERCGEEMKKQSNPLPLCGACPFVGYCGFCFSINYFRKKIM